MRIHVLLFTVVACALAIPSASATSAVEGFKATYRLVFNEELVGLAYAKLGMPENGRYQFDIFTLPAGKMDQNEGQEILESSEGSLGEDEVVPLRYDYSVRTRLATSALVQTFDRANARINLRSDSDEAEIELQPGSQDRISYVLRARQLAMHGTAGKQPLVLVGLDASFRTTLEYTGEKRKIDTGTGTYEAVAVSRSEPGNDLHRVLWFAPSQGFAPVLIERHWEKGELRMELESLQLAPPEKTAQSLNPD